MIAPEGYNKTDFAQLRFNVMEVADKKNIVDAFPELKTYPEFLVKLQDIDVNKMLRYILVLYDRQTPVIKVDNLIKRKIETAQMVGFETDEDGFFSESVDAAMKGFNRDVNCMIIRFCRMQGSSVFSALTTLNESYYYKLQLTLSPPESHKTKSEIELDKIKGELWKQAKSMMEDIGSLTKELLNEDNNPYLKKDLFCVIDRESQELMLSPEKIARNGKG